jgi:hypothetical protein
MYLTLKNTEKEKKKKKKLGIGLKDVIHWDDGSVQ